MIVRQIVIDHIDIFVKDLPPMKAFYQAVLAPLGFSIMKESETSVSFGANGADDLGINASDVQTSNVHFAFACDSREAVDQFYEHAIQAGGRSSMQPALHPEFHANYYAAFVYDPIGNHIEAVFHGR